jgi:hypothetical protein
MTYSIATTNRPRPYPVPDLRSTPSRPTPSPSRPYGTEWSGEVDKDANPVPDPVPVDEIRQTAERVR